VRSKNRKHVYPRENLAKFLDFLFKNFAVMVWSSAQPRNVHYMITKVFGNHKEKLVRVWDRRHCTLDGDYFSKSKSIKDLERLFSGWSLKDSPFKDVAPALYCQDLRSNATGSSSSSSNDENIGEASLRSQRFKWDLRTTLLIDDSESKATKQPENHICVSEYTRSTSDDELLVLMSYLREVLEYVKSKTDGDKSGGQQDCINIREFTRGNPWTRFCDAYSKKQCEKSESGGES
ncbi:hypothetical protein EV182_002901, partial [Spiromyces aspiralis]